MSFKDEREMHKATCADCGKECEVPFKPDEDRRNPESINDEKVSFCHNCNTKVENFHRFCFQCGVFLS